MPSDAKTKTPLTLGRGKLELKKTVESGQVRQSFSHGRSKVVQVERKRKRLFETGADGKVQEVKAVSPGLKQRAAEMFAKEVAGLQHGTLTDDEKAHRLKALQDAMRADEESRTRAEEDAKRQAEEDAQREAEEKLRPQEAAPAPTVADAAAAATAPAATAAVPGVPRAAPPRSVAETRPTTTPTTTAAPAVAPRRVEEAEEEDEVRKKAKTGHKPPTVKRTEPRRRAGKLSLGAALQGDDLVERSRSLASMRRAADKERRKMQTKQPMNTEKVVREVVLPEAITVQELSNRMAERSGNVVKALMKLGIMATINEVIDADTAELVAQEFGHSVKRVTEAAVEEGLSTGPDEDEEMVTRPPVVTVMGHVDPE